MMSAASWLLLVSSVLLDCLGQLGFKASANAMSQAAAPATWRDFARQRGLWLGVSCYLLLFFTWMALLSLVPLGKSVLMASASIVLVMVAGRWWFAEVLTPLRVAGMVLVAAGVALVGWAT